MDKLPVGKRITGKDRNVLGKELKKQYKAGVSIRQLAEDTGRSYGFIHNVLAQNDVAFRSRGGSRKQPSS